MAALASTSLLRHYRVSGPKEWLPITVTHLVSSLDHTLRQWLQSRTGRPWAGLHRPQEQAGLKVKYLAYHMRRQVAMSARKQVECLDHLVELAEPAASNGSPHSQLLTRRPEGGVPSGMVPSARVHRKLAGGDDLRKALIS